MKHRKRGEGNVLPPEPNASEGQTDSGLDYESVVLTLGEHGPRVLCHILKSDVDADRSKLFAQKNVRVVVQVRSNGQVMIVFGWEVAKNSQTDVLKVLRIREHEARDREEKRYDWKALSVAPELYGWRHEPERGTISTINLSTLSLDEIVGCIRLALNAGEFEVFEVDKKTTIVKWFSHGLFDLERGGWCRQGICQSRPGDQCPYYKLGLTRCAMIRKAAPSAAQNDEE